MPCAHCGRTFARDRLEKHQRVCMERTKYLDDVSPKALRTPPARKKILVARRLEPALVRKRTMLSVKILRDALDVRDPSERIGGSRIMNVTVPNHVAETRGIAKTTHPIVF